MATTVVTRQSFFSRIGNSIRGVFVGIVLILVGIILLFWNEGRAVKTAESLKEGATSVVGVSTDSIDPTNDGRLVHFSGEARTPSILIDSQFGAGGPALKLKRTVEVYQWVQTAESKTVEKLGGSTETTTTYTYKREWRDEIIDSSEFQEALGHTNPTSKLFENEEWVAENVSIGAFSIPSEMIRSLSNYQPLPVTDEVLATLPLDMQQNIEIISGILYYRTQDPANPQIGDTRITFEIIPTQTLSLIAGQKGGSLAPFSTSNGRAISFIQTGEATADQMFEGAIEGNLVMTWILRLLGIILLFAGFRSVFGLLPILASVIPPVGRLLGAGMSFVSFVLALVVGLIIISIAWIIARPIIGIGILIGAIVIFILALRLKGKKK